MSGLKFALTQPFKCNYLEDEKEQLLVCMPPDGIMQKRFYEWLISQGFRRSGEQIYRPHCAECSKCKSVRVPTANFEPTRSQKRILKKTRGWSFSFTSTITDKHYALYEKYITERHSDGSMFPPSKHQFMQFIDCSWHSPRLLEAKNERDELIAVAVTDVFDHALSALYTFFDADYERFSPGTLMILKQIEFAFAQDKPFVYLGYQVDECKKMAYKTKFMPQEQFIDGHWVQINKISN